MVTREKLFTTLVPLLFGCLVFALSANATADEGLLVLVTEETADDTGIDQAFWWESGAAPAWSPTDLALREALKAVGAGFSEPANLSSLSKIYRKPAPSDTNATAMATVFGRTTVLVGTVRYRPTTLRPVGLVGWTAEVSVRLVDRAASGTQVLRAVTFDRARWASNDDEARASLRQDVASGISAAIAGGLTRNVGPVGLDSDELMVGIVAPSTRAALDAARTKLASFAGVTSVQERWAAEGVVVLEVNPGVVDPPESMRQYVSLLTSEGAGRFRVVPVESRWPSVIALRLEEPK